MDGWGLGREASSDAIKNARVPFVSSLYKQYPNTTLVTYGEEVGLPEGQMGNSEVGHLNLGAGRIVNQELQRINVAVRDGSFGGNPVLLAAIRGALKDGKPLHLLGLVSEGGVHSHTRHLKAIVDACVAEGLKNVFVHAFTDGRDTDPKSGLGYVRDLQSHLEKTTGKIASVSGRYYAMDRDKRWERVKLAYDALVKGTGETSTDALAAIERSYLAGVTDEFIKPTVITSKDGKPLATIRDGDYVLCFNFRTDRCREITEVLTQQDHPEQGMKKLSLIYTTMTQYDAKFKGVKIIFENDDLRNTLGEIIASRGLKQIRIAETEKYPHVTFFFNDYRNDPFPGEERTIIPSPTDVSTYDQKPEMSAYGVCDEMLNRINSNQYDMLVVNFANGDMVGHTGVLDAAVKAVEHVDICVGRLLDAVQKQNGTAIVTADHGNCEQMIDPATGGPHTAHTTYPVELFVVDDRLKGKKLVEGGRLADVAPTALQMMGIEQPKEMNGRSLIG